LEPSPIPSVLHVEWHDLLPHLATCEDFRRVCLADGTESKDTRLADWARKTFLSHGNPIVNLADILERLVTGKTVRPPAITIVREKPQSLTQRILPNWLWMKYCQSKERQIKASTYEAFKKDIVSREELESRIQRWQQILSLK
jgi:hypothetical protein